MASELMEAIEILVREKNISKEAILSAIENSLVIAYKNQYNKNQYKKKDDSVLAAENVFARIDEETGEYFVYAEKTVVDEVTNPLTEISYADAKEIYPGCEVGNIVRLAAQDKDFSRIATQNAKNVLLQNLREKEKDNVYEDYHAKEKEVVTGIVQRINENNIVINLGKADGILNENEQVKSERIRVNERLKVYVLEVKNNKKSLRILVSRTHPDLVKKLFESEVAEIKDGTVEIMAIAREAGSRTKMAVWSNDPDVDPVGACVGMNGMRVNTVVSELKGEKIDIINWSDNPAILIENALSPAKVITVLADAEEKTATVIVPDYQLSLAIGKEGQNARLAAKLTGFKIDILNETQAADILDELYQGGYEEESYEDGEYYENEEYDDSQEELVDQDELIEQDDQDELVAQDGLEAQAELDDQDELVAQDGQEGLDDQETPAADPAEE